MKQSNLNELATPCKGSLVTAAGTAVAKSLEVVSKSQIRFKGKAQADRESAAYMGM